MDRSKIIVFALMVLAGGGAFFLIMGNEPEQTVQIIEKVEEKTVRVLVADGDLVRGERISAERIKWIDWPEKALSPQYFTEASISTEDLDNSVVRTSIVDGEPIFDGKIVREGSSGFMAAVLAPGMRAITTRVSPETASGGFILPGDIVDIYYADTSGNSNNANFRLLLEQVKVLAIDANYQENPEATFIGGGTATLELTPDDAEFFLSSRASRGEISLVLRSIFEPETPSDSKQRSNIQVIRYGRS